MNNSISAKVTPSTITMSLKDIYKNCEGLVSPEQLDELASALDRDINDQLFVALHDEKDIESRIAQIDASPVVSHIDLSYGTLDIHKLNGVKVVSDPGTNGTTTYIAPSDVFRV